MDWSDIKSMFRKKFVRLTYMCIVNHQILKTLYTPYVYYRQMERDEVLHELLDDSFAQLATTLEEYMRRNQRSIAEERSDFYTPQIESLKDRIRQGEELFANMEMNSGDMTSMIVRKEAVLDHMVKLSSRLHGKMRNGRSCSRAFNLWTEIGTDKVIASSMFKRVFLTGACKRIFFRRWRRKMYAAREFRLTHEVKARFEKESKAKSAETGRVVDRLEAELAAAKGELEEKQKTFLEMQQRLRKAFMRGVVNLNLEAMDVFNGAQMTDLVQEVEGAEAESVIDEAPVNESDGDFFVEEAPPVSVVRHH